MTSEIKDEVVQVSPKDLNEAIEIVFTNYMHSINWLINILDQQGSPYKIVNNVWYADQICNSFIAKLKVMQQQIDQKKKEELDAKALAATSELAQPASVQE
jgi:hypothetical protein